MNNVVSQQNPLLSLPAELRLEIWNMALLDGSQGIITPARRDRRSHEWDTKAGDQGFSRNWQPEVRENPSPHWSNQHNDQEPMLEEWVAVSPGPALHSALSLTCRRTYIDVVKGELLYRCCRFKFFYLHMFIVFLHHIRPDSRNCIQDIELALSWAAPDRFNWVEAHNALRVLSTCSGLRKLTLVMRTSTRDHSAYTGQYLVEIINCFQNIFEMYRVTGLEEFHFVLWGQWALVAQGSAGNATAVVGSGIWTEEAKYWSLDVKQKLELLVEAIRTRITAAR